MSDTTVQDELVKALNEIVLEMRKMREILKEIVDVGKESIEESKCEGEGYPTF